MEAKTGMSAPWYQRRNSIAKLFEFDDSVTVGDVREADDGYAVTLSVSNHAKAYALKEFFKKPYEYCNVKLSVIIEDIAAPDNIVELLKDAFAHNRLIRGVETVEYPAGGKRVFVVVEPDFVQFWADNLADYNGNVTMLASDAAQSVFGECGATFCTADLREN